jgi:hypothetical protein
LKLLNRITNYKDDSEQHENNINLLNGLCKGIIRSQYYKIQRMNVKTIIYSDAHTLSDEKIQDNVVFNENSDDMIIYYYIIGVH